MAKYFKAERKRFRKENFGFHSVRREVRGVNTIKMEEKFNVWFILDIAIRVFAVIALIPIIADYYRGFLQTLLIGLFILWAFRPIYLVFKKFKLSK
ncbi:hypothetical protein HYT91_00285 [Candidatus Pacearchaeota archaeon]|nr:hypothetical protein [Candidatus Pacearchaeota archaeon]